MTGARDNNQRGFTLIEIIVTIIVGAIMMTMLVVFMGTNYTQSVNPIVMVGEQNELNQVMEKIVEEYKTRLKSSTLKLNTFYSWINTNYGDYVDSGNTNYIDIPSYQEATCTYGSAGCLGLKVTLKKNNLKLMGLFTE
ncbi:MAG: prepilin-type N-terminal cleavage/methylation domain-containing protein [Candidatus Latescibacterota bacterium]